MTQTDDKYVCPITLSLMTDPVIAPDGYTYERTAIEEWLHRHGTSPQTRQAMHARHLVPNRAIKDLIDEHNNNTAAAATAAAAAATLSTQPTPPAPSAPPADPTPKPQPPPPIANETKRHFLPEELTKTTSSTKATLHPSPSSPRVHIQTPNPTTSQVNETLTTPHHICCVIDVSGSMGLPASTRDENGRYAESIGLSVLDVVKFSTFVISQSLNPQDKLSIVTYGDDAKIAFPPTYMDTAGKTLVKEKLDEIPLQARTNLFAGVKMGMGVTAGVGEEFVNSIFVLTDGVPTEHPPLGYARSLTKVLARDPIFGMLSTFGFGYELDSRLLVEIGEGIGGGGYSYIPDAGMVGTCFINAVANCRCVYGVRPILKISGGEFTSENLSGIITGRVPNRNKGSSSSGFEKYGGSGGSKEEAVLGLTLDKSLVSTLVDGDIYIRLNPLRYGADVDVVLHPKILEGRGDGIQIQLFFDIVGGETVNVDVVAADGVEEGGDCFHGERARFVGIARGVCARPYEDASRDVFLNAVKGDAAAAAGSYNTELEALRSDMNGQATEAIESKATYDRWGRHYLLSLSTAHLHQFCNNFKDPGVQTYGNGELFGDLQDELDDIFKNVPAPTPGRINQTVPTYGGGGLAKAGAGVGHGVGVGHGAGVGTGRIDMSTVYNNRRALCVHGDTIITVQTESLSRRNIPIRNVQKGDRVLTSDGTFVEVEYLVETTVDSNDNNNNNNNNNNKPFELLQVGQLRVTPYHPIRTTPDSQWCFPIDHLLSKCTTGTADVTYANSVYNLVLVRGERHRAVCMDGTIDVITLGHGIVDDDVLRHDYLGTDRVVDDLERLADGQKDDGCGVGHVVVRECDFGRDAVSGRLCALSDGMEHCVVPSVVAC